MNNSLSVSIITVAYNSADVLREFWTDFSADWAEWIVVDNASTDASSTVAEELGARVIQLGENVGFSAANNAGVRASSGDVLLFCNPDVRVSGPGLAKLAATASAGRHIVGPQLLNSDGSLQENGRGAPFPHRKIRHLFKGKSTQEDAYSRLARGSGLLPVVWVMGAALVMTRDVFTDIGGWNERYFLYYEDADICLRAMHAGVPTFVDGGVRWTHGWARETARGVSWSAWRRECASAIRFYTTHRYLVVPFGRRARLTLTRDKQGLKDDNCS